MSSKHLPITRSTSRLQPRLQSALFASALQPSAPLTPELVAEAISQTMRKLGRRGCDGTMAQEFGDHPEAAAERMRWIRQHLAEASVQGLAELDWHGPAAPSAQEADDVVGELGVVLEQEAVARVGVDLHPRLRVQAGEQVRVVNENHLVAVAVRGEHGHLQRLDEPGSSA